MKKSATKLRFENPPKDYASLCRRLPPRRIHDDVDYDNIVETTDAMALRQDDFTGINETILTCSAPCWRNMTWST